MATKDAFKEITKDMIKEPRQYNVVMFNDDFTTMEFVVDILVDVFHKDEVTAQSIMMKVHKMGQAVVGKYPYDIKYEDDYDIINEKLKKNKLEINNENHYSQLFIDFIEKLLKKDINERISLYEAMNHQWIKGGEILYNEKEKIFNIYSFTTQLITDNIKEFNDYILKQK